MQKPSAAGDVFVESWSIPPYCLDSTSPWMCSVMVYDVPGVPPSVYVLSVVKTPAKPEPRYWRQGTLR